jgi:hypothetical protein
MKKRLAAIGVVLVAAAIIVGVVSVVVQAQAPSNTIYFELEIVEGDDILIYESGSNTPLVAWHWYNMKPGYSHEKTFKVYNTTQVATTRQAVLDADISAIAEITVEPETFTLNPGEFESVHVVVFVSPSAQPTLTGINLTFEEYTP